MVAEDRPAKHVATMPHSVTMTPSHSAPPTRTSAMLLGTCGGGVFQGLGLQCGLCEQPLPSAHKCAVLV